MNESRATRYQRLRRRARAAGVACAVVTLSAVALTPIAETLAHLAARLAPSASAPGAHAASITIFVVLLVLLWEVATLPATLFLALRVDRAYTRSTTTVEDVLGAQIQSAAIVLPAALVAAATVQASVALAGRWWWIPAAVVLVVVMAAALRLTPALVNRMATVRPLARHDLAADLADLARRARVPIAAISEWVVSGEEPATALVTGVGRHRRVLLSSEIARRWTDEEVVVVVAHELAHHVYRDLWRTLVLDVLVLSTALLAAEAGVRLAGPRLGLSGSGDIAALPLMALVAMIVWLVSTPLRYAHSRRQERRADLFALAMTNGAEAFGSAIRRLGARHLAEEHPSALTRWLSHRHPSVAERLALAEAYRRVRPGISN